MNNSAKLQVGKIYRHTMTYDPQDKVIFLVLKIEQRLVCILNSDSTIEWISLESDFGSVNNEKL